MGKKDRSEPGKDKRQERMEKAQFRKERARRQYSKEEWTAETKRLSDQIRPFGLRICDVASDGNCLFRAFSDQLEGNQSNHATYRQRACDFIESQRDWFQPFIEDDVSFEEYVREMRKDKIWGGNIEIQALSMMLQINVNIHQCDHPVWQVSNNPRKGAPSINISYHDGQHYCSLRSVNQAAVLPVTEAFSKDKATDFAASESGRTEEERIIMNATGCKSLDLVRGFLEDFGEIDLVIEFLLANPEMCESDGNPGASSPSAASSSSSKSRDGKGREKLELSEPPSRAEKASAKAAAHMSNRQRKELQKQEKAKDKEEKKRDKQKADEEVATKMEVMSI